MTTINNSLPDHIKEYADQRVSLEGYCTSSESFLELVGHNKDRSQLRAMMLKGLESPATGPAHTEYFQTLRKQAERRKNP